MSDTESELDIPAEELVRRIATGTDREAEELLVRKYGPGVMELLRYRYWGDRRIDDVFQETMIIVITRLRERGINEPKKLAQFIRGVVPKAYKTQLRKDHDMDTSTGSIEIDIKPDDDPSIVQGIEFEQRKELVNQLMLEVPNKRYQEILYRTYVLDQSKKEICLIMNLKPNRFDSVIHLAKTSYKKILIKHGYEELDAF